MQCCHRQRSLVFAVYRGKTMSILLGWLLESKLWNKIKLCLWWHRDGSLFSMDNVNEIHRAILSYDSIVNTIITVTCIDKLNKQGGPMWQNYPTTKKKPLAPAQKYAMGYRVIKNNRVKQCIVFQQCHTPAYLTVMCSLAVWGAVLSQSVTVDLCQLSLGTESSAVLSQTEKLGVRCV